MRTWMALSALLLMGCGAPPSLASETVEPAPTPLEVELRGNRIVFNHRIQFAHDSDRILQPSFEVLDRVVTLMVEHENLIRIQVQGHSSTDGNTAHNQDLSSRRAEAVAQYLRTHGVAQEVTSQGYGETYPLCHEDTADCHDVNRRVEFFVDER